MLIIFIMFKMFSDKDYSSDPFTSLALDLTKFFLFRLPIVLKIIPFLIPLMSNLAVVVSKELSLYELKLKSSSYR